MYNLLYFQVIVKLCSSLTEIECDQIIERFTADETHACGFRNLGSVMTFVLKTTNNCRNFRTNSAFDASTPFASTSTTTLLNMNLFEQKLQKLCLPFLRIATLLRHHLYEQNLPEIEVPQMEFTCLVTFLELVTVDTNWDSFDAAKALCFVPGHERKLPELWCNQLIQLHRSSEPDDQHKAIAIVVNNQHTLWQQPSLLRLPSEYEKLFTVNTEKLFFLPLLFYN